MYLDLVFFENLADLELFSKKFRQEFIVCRNFKNDFELKQLKEKIKGKNLKVCHLLLNANMQELQKFRQKVDFIAVFGKNLQRNKFAVSSEKVDFLLMPAGNARKPEFDAGLARIAAENKVVIGILFNEFLNSNPEDLKDLLRNYLLVARLCKKYKAQLAVFSGAKNAFDLRQVKDFASFLCFLGLKRETALKQVRGLSEFLEKKGKLEGFEILSNSCKNLTTVKKPKFFDILEMVKS